MRWEAALAGYFLGPAYHALTHLTLDSGCTLAPSFVQCAAEEAEVPSTAETPTDERRLRSDFMIRNCMAEGRSYMECQQELQDVERAGPQIIGAGIPAIGVGLFTLLGPLVLGFMYMPQVTNKREMVAGKAFPEVRDIPPPYNQANPPNDFYPSLFDCCDHCSVCLWSFCVYPVRMGDTYASTGVVDNFWLPAMVFYAGIVVLLFKDFVIIGLLGIQVGSWFDVAVAVVQACVYASWRGKLRQRLGHPNVGTPPSGTFVNDAFAQCCCRNCATAQEARNVDSAWGLDVQCPMKLSKTNDQMNPLVGAPTRVQPANAESNAVEPAIA